MASKELPLDELNKSAEDGNSEHNTENQGWKNIEDELFTAPVQNDDQNISPQDTCDKSKSTSMQEAETDNNDKSQHDTDIQPRQRGRSVSTEENLLAFRNPENPACIPNMSREEDLVPVKEKYLKRKLKAKAKKRKHKKHKKQRR